MKQANVKFGIAAAVVLSLIACGKNKGDSNVSVSGTPVVQGTYTAGPSGLPTGQAGVSKSTGAKVTSSLDVTSFTDQVKGLLGADPSVNLNNIGTVNNQNGVDLFGEVSVNATNGAIMPAGWNGASSRIQLVITDSKVAEGQKPISIIMAQGSGGASNGSARLTFSDSYGQITIQGTYNATTFTGTVGYSNTSGNRRSGTIGNFSIPTCAFFVCQ